MVLRHLFETFIRQQNISFFSSSFCGTFLWASKIFERYDFLYIYILLFTIKFCCMK